MKKLISILLTLVMLCGVVPVVYGASTDKSGSGEMEYYDYVFPSPFENDETVKSAVIESGVIEVGARTFSGCSNLTSIKLCEGVERIDEYAFNTNAKEAVVTLPLSLKSIGMGAFSGELTIHYAGTEEQWKAVNKYNQFYNSNLYNATMIYNSKGPKPAPPQAAVEKIKTAYGYNLKVTTQGVIDKKSYVYGAGYDGNGLLVSINRIKLSESGVTEVPLTTSGKEKKIKVFIWSADFEPIVEAKDV